MSGFEMDPNFFGQLTSLASLGLAFFVAAGNRRKDRLAEAERIRAQGISQENTDNKLTNVEDIARETRDTVRDMSKQLNEHQVGIAQTHIQMGELEKRQSARSNELERRIERIEQRCESCRIGGTE
nr:hypothetical protein [uncultured Olsenella sp.]